MKTKIHPTYHPNAKVVCACGNKFATGSTMAEIHTEICSHCHPFYTGKQHLIDTAGRVERFQKLVTKAATKKAALSVRKVSKVKAAAPAPKEDTAARLKKLRAELDSK